MEFTRGFADGYRVLDKPVRGVATSVSPSMKTGPTVHYRDGTGRNFGTVVFSIFRERATRNCCAGRQITSSLPQATVIPSLLANMQQRYYDPVAGRFLSIDPVTTDANTGGSFNRYAYADNSPYRYIDPDGRDACPGQSANVCIRSDNFDSNKSNGQATIAAPEVAKTMVSQKGVVAVTDPGAAGEKMGFIVPNGNGLSLKLATDATTGSTSSTETASAPKPADALAVVHGHIDGAMNVVGPGDAAPLKLGLPNGVVNEGRVGVTEIVGGRLQFRMLEGKMRTPERRSQQGMLDAQQSQFDK
jgi:RHS repeat-associated protein